MINTATLLFLGKFVLIAIVAYFLGSINSAIIVGKMHKIDIREHGSGNAGLTNTLRTLGKGAAGLVLLGDILKGVLAITYARLVNPSVTEYFTMFGEQLSFERSFVDLAVQIAGIAVIIGHIFPIFYKFKGGKGVLTSITVIMMTQWQVGLCCLGVFILVVALTRYVSLGSIMAAITYPFFIIIVDSYLDFMPDPSWIIFACILAAIVIWGHRGNLVRLWNNTERKLGEKKDRINTEETKTEEAK